MSVCYHSIFWIKCFSVTPGKLLVSKSARFSDDWTLAICKIPSVLNIVPKVKIDFLLDFSYLLKCDGRTHGRWWTAVYQIEGDK